MGWEKRRSVRVRAAVAIGALGLALVGPAVPTAAQVGPIVIDFADQVPGQAPSDWSPLWREADWVVADEPRRLVHNASTSGRQALSPDVVGEVTGDIEVVALVRTPSNLQGGTRKVLLVHAGGEAGSEDSYYVDLRWTSTDGPRFRLNRHNNGAFTTLENGPILDEPPVEGIWYQMVLQREGEALRVKVWPFGEDEPDGWMIETVDTSHEAGRVAVGHTTGGGVMTEWAYLAVGQPGTVPRAPAGTVPVPTRPEPPEIEAVALDRHLSVRWNPLEGADWYEVERDDELVASPWSLTAYADPLVAAGDEASYRVRGVSAVLGAGEWSQPDTAIAPPSAFPDHPVPFEESGGQLTSLDDEQAFLAEIDAVSDRVEVDEVGSSVEGRPIQLVRIGHPRAPQEAEIRERPTVYAICTVHGNEWTARESCLKFIRDLALTDDPAVTAILEEHAVIVTPAANPDGRAANVRANAHGIDVNRDYLALETPEARAIVDVLNRFEPAVVLDGHNCCDDSVVAMWSQNLNVSNGLRGTGRDLVHDGLLTTADAVGFTNTTSPLGTLGNPGIARNYTGLRHSVGILNEVRGSAIAGRLQEATGYPGATLNRRHRAVAAFDMAIDATFAYAVDNRDQIDAAIAQSASEAKSNQGPVYLGGDEANPPGEEEIIDPAPCGYMLSDAQHGQPRMAERLGLHAFERQDALNGVFVPMAQRSRAVVPLLLDSRSPWAVVEGVVLDDRQPTVVVGGVDSGAPNHELPGGCTVNDLIQAAGWWDTKGAFIRHVDEVVRALRSNGVLNAREAADIRSAAARSDAEPPPLPPGPTPPAQHATDFSDGAVGVPPQGWSSAWTDSNWTVLDEPRRLQHVVDDDSGRRALTWDEVGDAGHVQGDVEVAGVVRVPAPLPATRFQVTIDIGGAVGSENAYYLDVQGDNLRLNRYAAGGFSSLSSAALPFTVEAETWYRVVLQREGTMLRAKMWPDGQDEPDAWQATTTGATSTGGRVGVSHFTPGAVNDWAWLSVGTGGLPAPRAPDDLLEP